MPKWLSLGIKKVASASGPRSSEQALQVNLKTSLEPIWPRLFACETLTHHPVCLHWPLHGIGWNRRWRPTTCLDVGLFCGGAPSLPHYKLVLSTPSHRLQLTDGQKHWVSWGRNQGPTTYGEAGVLCG